MNSKTIYRYSIPLALVILITAWLISRMGGGDATSTAFNKPVLGPANPTILDTKLDTKKDKGFLVLSGGAYHFKNFNERNAFTPGIGWEYSPSGKIGWHAGTLSDSFGYQAMYGGINYATQPKFYGRVRFLLGASIVHKQYKKNGDPETKLLPIPAMEVKLNKRAVLNVSGTPQVDYGDHKSNGVLFFQLKVKLD